MKYQSFNNRFTDRIISPMIIGEILCSYIQTDRSNYFADDHRRDLVFFLYTERITSPMNIGDKVALSMVVKVIFTY